MTMITVPMQFPETMAPFIEDENHARAFEKNTMILYPFIQNLMISHGRAAEILGVHKFELMTSIVQWDCRSSINQLTTWKLN